MKRATAAPENASEPARKNLKVEIGILEAISGLEPSISWCKDVAAARRFGSRSRLESSPGERLAMLRKERIQRKLHFVLKQINKAAKKAKAFTIQRLVRKIKSVSDDEPKENFEEQLLLLKKFDHAKLAARLCADLVVNGSMYISTKLAECGICGGDSARMGGEDAGQDMVDGKALRKCVAEIAAEFEGFLKKLFHEMPLPVQPETPRQEKGERPQEDSKLESFFVSSLSNRDERALLPREGKKTSLGAFQARPRGRTSRHSVGRDPSPSRSPSPLPRKNRPGQRARRALAEKKYGNQAKHVLADRKSHAPSRARSMARSREGQSDGHGHGHNRGSIESETRSLRAKPSASSDKPIHPSWQAKKALQAKASVEFAGTKVRFED